MSSYNESSEIESLLVSPGTPRLNGSYPAGSSKIVHLFRTIPWVTIICVIILLTLFGLCTWFQIHESKQAGIHINHSAFENFQGQIIAQNSFWLSNQILSKNSSILFIVMSLPISICLILLVFAIILNHFTAFPQNGLLSLDTSRPTLQNIRSVPAQLQDRKRIGGGMLSISMFIAVLLYSSYAIYAGYFLNIQLSHRTTLSFPMNFEFATQTDFVVQIAPNMKDVSGPFCSCNDQDIVPFCFAGLPDTMWDVEILNKQCSVKDTVIELSWSEFQYTHGGGWNWKSLLPVEVAPLWQDAWNTTTYIPIIIPGNQYPDGTFTLSFGINNYLLKGETYTDVFRTKDPVMLRTFPLQNKAFYLSNAETRVNWVTLTQNYVTSCTQDLVEHLTGSYEFIADHFAVGYDDQDPSQFTAPLYNTTLSALGIHRTEPPIPNKIQCIVSKRNFFKTVLSILTFVGSMVGLRSLLRNILMMHEPALYRLRRFCS